MPSAMPSADAAKDVYESTMLKDDAVIAATDIVSHISAYTCVSARDI